MDKRTFMKNVSSKMLGFFPFKILLAQSKEKAIFPFYHLVSDQPSAHTRHLYNTISSEQFQKDIKFLLKHYEPASFENLAQFVKDGKKTSKPLFLLTFDDGMRECAEVVAPILVEMGLSAIFFLNSAFIDNKTLFHKHKCSLLIEKMLNTHSQSQIREVRQLLNSTEKNLQILVGLLRKLNYSDGVLIEKIAEVLDLDFERYLAENKPYMSSEQIRSLLAKGFLIGAHSIDHPEFFLLEEKEMERQTHESFTFLEKYFGLGQRLFAFPYTDDRVSQSFFAYLKNQEKVDISFGTAGLKRDENPCHIQRIPMENGTLTGAQQIIRMEYSYYLLKSVLGKNELTRK
jgi:peptidoglycan/xylan/chitin deacetylase (PgdA/CDA1 family)